MAYDIGMRVIGVGSYDGNKIDGIPGTVIVVGEALNYCVEFDRPPPNGGHNGDGSGRADHCWWVEDWAIKPYVNDNEDAAKLLTRDTSYLPTL